MKNVFQKFIFSYGKIFVGDIFSTLFYTFNIDILNRYL